MQSALRPQQGIQARPGIPAARPAAPAARPSAASMQNRPTTVAAGSAGVKRPGSPAPAAQAFKKPMLSIPASAIAVIGSKETPKFTVTSSSKKDDIGIQTLVGDYADRGANHGKRFYQKVQKIPGHEDIKVFLYYWDQRDGADFSGWWFGDQVGGTQVWARNASAAPSPLRVGWKVPWDAPTSQPGLLFVDPYKAPAAAAVATPVTSPANSRTASPGGLIKPAVSTPGKGGLIKPVVSTPANTATSAAGLQARLQKATAQVTQAEKATNDAVSKSKATLSAASPTQAAVTQLQQSLTKQQVALQECQKNLTLDISEARKGGVPAVSSITELSKLSQKIRTSQASLTAELNKVRIQMTKPVQPVQTAAQQADVKKKEEADTKNLDESLPAATELAAAIEESVKAIVDMADPIVADPPDQDSAELKTAFDEIESASKDAETRIAEARQQITQKLQAARNYAPETRKTALDAFSRLQVQLAEVQKKLAPFKTFRKDFQSRVQAKKSLAELADKLSSAELEVEKAAMMSSVSDGGQMADEDIASTDKAVTAAQAEIGAAVRTIEQKLRGAQGAMKDELMQLKDRAAVLRKKAESVTAGTQGQRSALAAKKMLTEGAEKVVAAEEAVALCQDAEMPFLKGIEVLPAEESSKALAECDAAAVKADSAINHARSFFRLKLGDSKSFSKDLATTTTEELNQLSARVEASGKKVADFKKETAERKLTAAMAEVINAIRVAELKVKAYSEVAKIFSEDLASVTVEALREAMGRTSSVESEANAALQEAKKEVALKQKTAKSPDATMQKLQARLTTVQQDLAKHRTAAANGDKLIKGKALLPLEEEKLKVAEDEVDKVEQLAAPAEASGGDLSDEDMQKVGDAMVAAQEAVKAVSKSLELQLAGAVPGLKAALQKLADRSKKAQEKLDKAGSTSKDQREKMLGDAYVREGKRKTEQVEAAVEKVNNAELPFLKGIEVLPLAESTATISESEKASQVLAAAVTEARNYIASKSIEVKKLFVGEKSKPMVDELAQFTAKINAASTKLTQFRKDTEARKKTAQLQEAGEKITDADASVAKAAEEAAPLAGEEAAAWTAEEAVVACQKDLLDSVRILMVARQKDAQGVASLTETIKKLRGGLSEGGATVKSAQDLLDSVRILMVARQKDAQGVASLTETIKKLQARVSTANLSLVKSKKLVTDLDQKFVAQRVLVEATEIVNGLDAEVKAAEAACAPLLEKGGEEFLVSNSIQTLAAALRRHMQEKSVGVDVLFSEACGDKKVKAIAHQDFVAYLTKLPDAIGHPEVSFTEERKAAIVKHLDPEAVGKIGLAEFKGIFVHRYECVTGISLTDVLKVSDSKTVGKVEPKELLENIGEPSKDETTGVERVEVKVLGSGSTGFVTMKGNQGTVYIKLFSRFPAFCTEMDKAVEERLRSIRKSIAIVDSKSRELNIVSAAPADKKAELGKLRSKAQAQAVALEQLKKNILTAKRDFAKKEVDEKNAHIEAKEKKEAEAFTAVAAVEVEACEVDAKKVEDAAAPLVSLQVADVQSFATPAALQQQVEKLSTAALASIAKARAIIKEQQEKIQKATSGPEMRAKKDLQSLTNRVQAAAAKSSLAFQAVNKACKTIVDGKYALASAVLRKEISEKGLTVEKLFSEIAGKGKDRISEQAFCKHLTSVGSLVVNAEQAMLICRRIELDGIGKRRFASFVQLYFIAMNLVMKAIAVTSEFDISKATTLRKVDLQEVIEVLEGPLTDEKLGLTRIRGKSLLDSAEGWITVKGNQGTPFLKETEKPFYTVAGTDEVPLSADATKTAVGSTPLRSLKLGEVMELIAGPKKESFANGLRARGKASSDGAMGWFTVRDKLGKAFVEADLKLYTCVSAVAMTSAFEIKSDIVKKLSVGDTLTLEEGPAEEPSAGVTRIKGKTSKDGVVGWITVKGNAGTVYAENIAKQYTVLRAMPLQKALGSAASPTFRQLEVGEVLQVLEGPKDEVHQPELRAKVRAVSDGTEGWANATEDGAVGWVSVRDASGKKLLIDCM
ncbi:unnamed protein product [Polarella glacialis]|uniref:Uncharacterized protein n=1 Tax=Polarella glacialis TaxID=89957 RepID=A0A813L8T4_POLGL|nr:unnamed protein product [Polarella glacialis]